MNQERSGDAKLPSTQGKPNVTPGPYRASNDVNGKIMGGVRQAGRDIFDVDDHSTHNRLEVPDPFDELFQGRGFGRLTLVIGVIVALAGFGGWMYLIFHAVYLIFQAGEIDDPSFNPFDDKILGISAPMVAFGSFAVGTVISHIGLGLSRAARERRRELERRRPPLGRRS